MHCSNPKNDNPISNNYLLIFFKCLTSSTFVNEHIDWPLSNAWMFLLLMHLPIDLFQDYELLFYWCACWTTFLKCVTSSFVDAFANQLLWSTWLPSSSKLYWHSYNHSLVALKKPKYPSSRGHTYRPTNKHSLVAFKKPKYWSFVGTHVKLKVAIVLLMFINTYLLGTKKTLISFCYHFNPSLSNLLASSTKKWKHQSMFFLIVLLDVKWCTWEKCKMDMVKLENALEIDAFFQFCPIFFPFVNSSPCFFYYTPCFRWT